FPAELLARPIVWADYELLLTLERVACQRLADQEQQLSTLTDTLRAIIYTLLSPQFPSLESVAAQVHLSVRELQRRLKAEGTSFARLKTEIRKELALHYLSQELSTKEITYLMGYSEPSAFVSAFTGWFGQSPGQYRQVNAKG
ncbi:MAG: helix-turn-helix transcriptional regulator, partial [Bacteroidota bacterium]